MVSHYALHLEVGYVEMCVEALEIDDWAPPPIFLRHYKQRAVKASWAVYLLYGLLQPEVADFLIQDFFLVC